MNLKYLAIVAISSSLLLAGCGTDGTTTDETTTNTSSNPTVTGVISSRDANSITVNNVIYDTSNATFTDEGVPVDSSAVTNGQFVTVEGTQSDGQGIADVVRYDSEVEGFVVSSDIVALAMDTVDSVATYEGTMNVMGQDITIDPMTKFFGIADPTTIVANNVVEVSGDFEADGSIIARYVEYKAEALMPGEEIEIKGYVSAYDATGGVEELGSFMLGGCSIYVTSNTDNEIAVLEDGMNVEVESITEDIVSTDPCEINAGEIENKDHNGYFNMDKAEGMVQGDLIDGMFTLQHEDDVPVQVMVDENTNYMNGTVDSIIEGAKLKAIGIYNENDVLMAKFIKFDDIDMKFNKIEGTVVSDLVNDMFDIEDEDGVTVTVMIAPSTIYLPMGASALDILVGAKLKAVGKYNSNNMLVADLIKLDGMPAMPLDKVKGEVTSVSDPMDGSFVVTDKDGNAVDVVVNMDTKYFPMGTTEADIKIGVMLMAAGTIDATTNILTASLITIKDMGSVNPPLPGAPPAVKFNGTVEDVTLTDANDPTLGGTLTLLGQTITVTVDTKIISEVTPDPITTLPTLPGTGTTPGTGAGTPAVDVVLTLADVAAGDYVMVMAYTDDTGTTAKTIKVKATPEVVTSAVFGVITAADETNSTLTIGGVVVIVDSTTEIKPTGTDISTIAAALLAGTELTGKAEGTYDATTGFIASQVKVNDPSTPFM